MMILPLRRIISRTFPRIFPDIREMRHLVWPTLLLAFAPSGRPPRTTRRLSALKQTGTAVLLVLADLGEIRALADRIRVINGGPIAG
jgi:hypothetical protein